MRGMRGGVTNIKCDLKLAFGFIKDEID